MKKQKNAKKVSKKIIKKEGDHEMEVALLRGRCVSMRDENDSLIRQLNEMRDANNKLGEMVNSLGFLAANMQAFSETGEDEDLYRGLCE